GGCAAVTRPGVGCGEGGRRRAIHLALVVRRDRQRCRGDRQRAREIRDRVIGIDRTAGGDAIWAACHMAAGGGGRRQRGRGGQAARGVAVYQPRVRRGERRQSRAVHLGLVVRRDRQRRRGDRQACRERADRVVRGPR